MTEHALRVALSGRRIVLRWCLLPFTLYGDLSSTTWTCVKSTAWCTCTTRKVSDQCACVLHAVTADVTSMTDRVVDWVLTLSVQQSSYGRHPGCIMPLRLDDWYLSLRGRLFAVMSTGE